MPVIIDGTTGITTPGVTDTGDLSVAGNTTLTNAAGVASGGTGRTTLTANNVLLGNGTAAVQQVAPGTSGNVLTSNGTTWSSGAPVTGALIYLSTITANNSATIDVENTFSTYDTYVIIGSNITPQNSNEPLKALLKINDAYQTSGYEYGGFSFFSAVTAYNGTAATAINITDAILLSATSYALNFVCYISVPSSTTKIKGIWGDFGNNAVGSTTKLFGKFGGNYKSGTQALTGIRFFMNSGNLTSGTFRLYGYTNS